MAITNLPVLNSASSASLLLGGAAGAYSALVTIYKQNNRAIMAAGQTTLVAEAVVEERHSDEMQITDHPTEFGATISDHTFKLPATVILTYGWSESPTGLASATLSAVQSVLSGTGSIDQFFGTGKVNQIYAQLVAFQTQRTVVAINTGRRSYPSMLLKSLTVVTDKDTENALMIRAEFREINFVSAVQTNDLDSNTQDSAADTGSCIDQGTKSVSLVGS